MNGCENKWNEDKVVEEGDNEDMDEEEDPNNDDIWEMSDEFLL